MAQTFNSLKREDIFVFGLGIHEIILTIPKLDFYKISSFPLNEN
jgi:hypothetical protein